MRGASLYRIYRGTTNDQASATDVGTTPANYFFDSSAAVGQNYFYWVRAENGSATSLLSASDAGLRAVGTDNPTGSHFEAQDVLETGAVVMSDASDTLRTNPEVQKAYLGT